MIPVLELVIAPSPHLRLVEKFVVPVLQGCHFVSIRILYLVSTACCWSERVSHFADTWGRVPLRILAEPMSRYSANTVNSQI